MTAGIRVTPEQLQSMSSHVARGSGEIEGQLAALRSLVSPLVGGEWAGAASAQFGTLWDEWQRSAAGLREALDGISTLLGTAGANYASAESQIASSFRF